MKKGDIYNRLTAEKCLGHGIWSFRCSCGSEYRTLGARVKIGHVKSCGCLKKERHTSFGQNMLKHRVKHGLHRHPMYYTWIRMRHRCLSPKDKQYKNYGARGITIDKRWDKFENFLEDMGTKPSPQHSLGRIDNSRGYSKRNCRWETWLQQENNKRSNRFITYDGKTQTQSQWAKELGIGVDTLSLRLKAKWPLDKVLTAKDFRK